MRLFLTAVFILALTGCAGHNMDGHMDHNPLGGATVTEVAPSSATDGNMIVIQAEIKRMVNAQGITNASLYWILNGTKSLDNRSVYDVTIHVEDIRKRFIFGLTDGVIKMVKEIPVEAEVDCQHEGEQYEGRDQA